MHKDIMFDQQMRDLFVSKYSTVGEDNFFNFLLAYGSTRLENINLLDQNKKTELSPENELMQFYFIFLDLYRGKNQDVYLEMAKQFRRAAHYIYWDMIKLGLTEKNNGFMYLVKD